MKSSRLVLHWCSRISTLLLVGACSRHSPSESSAALPEGVLAEVAGRPITAALVHETGLTPERAVEHLVRAELIAAHMTEQDPALLRVAQRASLARSLLEGLRADALSKAGPITSDEANDLVRHRWVELDRPRSVRTAHLVVLAQDEGRSEAARAHAEQLADAVRGIVEPNEFADRARAASAELGLPEGTSLRVEALPPVAEDGRTVPVDVLDRGGPRSLVEEYAQAAARLQRVGDQSPVVETSYGYHVLLATEILPEVRPAAADVLDMVREEALSLRARPERERLMGSLRQATSIEVSRNAEELTRMVWERQ